MFDRSVRTARQALAGLAVAALLAAPAARAADVTVFAAASLKNALDDVNAAWKAEAGKEATISYAASSALAKQIEEGAPADVFVSADLPGWTISPSANLIETDTRRRAARQPPRADRAGRFRRQPSRSTPASTSPTRSATAGSPWPRSNRCRPASTARRR